MFDYIFDVCLSKRGRTRERNILMLFFEFLHVWQKSQRGEIDRVFW